jgi:hypothetical protein
VRGIWNVSASFSELLFAKLLKTKLKVNESCPIDIRKELLKAFKNLVESLTKSRENQEIAMTVLE